MKNLTKTILVGLFILFASLASIPGILAIICLALYETIY